MQVVMRRVTKIVPMALLAKKLISGHNWDLHCKPTKRVF
jgi:hypothetical protein